MGAPPSVGAAEAQTRATVLAARIRTAARATGVAATFALSAFAGFGAEPTAMRPTQIETGFEPRPYAMAYAVREAVEQRRAERQFGGVIAALDTDAAARPDVPVTAYRPAPDAIDAPDALDRFDAFVGGTLALGAPDQALVVPVPTMRPVGAATVPLVGDPTPRP